MGMAARSSFCTTGVSISSGSFERVAWTLSRTSWAATSTGRSSSKRTTTIETLSKLDGAERLEAPRWC